jgi:hypothetical protein
MFLVFNISNLEIPIDNFNKPKLEIWREYLKLKG